MEGLSIQDWSLIARYLNEEANDTDLARLNLLLQLHPGLEEEIREMGLHVQTAAPDFDSASAFKKLHERFKDEHLI